MKDQHRPQASDTILMIRPAAFGFNSETAQDNAFQSPSGNINHNISIEALKEFEHMVTSLKQAHIRVLVVDDTAHPQKPDAIFPNNWFSTHSDGSLITYPMFSQIRRQERLNPVVPLLEKHYQIKRSVALEHFEQQQQFLEGTGSIVFDHPRRLAFACRSLRTDETLLRKVCDELKYQAVIFDAKDENGKAIYHTNVMLSITTSLAIVCMESIEESQQDQVIEKLLADKELLVVNPEQMRNFCCNVLEVKSTTGQSYLTMSTRAYSAFDQDQIQLMERFHQIIHYPLTQIENIGGGGSRCMMAEIFLASRS